MGLVGSRRSESSARHAVHPSETVVAEGPITDLGMNGAAGHLVVTKERFIWAYDKRPDVVVEMEFKTVFSVATREEDNAVKLTSRDAEYGAMLNDPSNPHGEVDAVLDCGKDAQLAKALVSGTEQGSDSWATWREAPLHLLALKNTPVINWPSCPECEHALQPSAAAHSVRCAGCGIYFSDAGFRPSVLDGGPTHGELVGDEKYPPILLVEFGLAGWPMPWILRPLKYAGAPVTVMHSEIVERAAAIVSGRTS